MAAISPHLADPRAEHDGSEASAAIRESPSSYWGGTGLAAAACAVCVSPWRSWASPRTAERCSRSGLSPRTEATHHDERM